MTRNDFFYQQFIKSLNVNNSPFGNHELVVIFN